MFFFFFSLNFIKKILKCICLLVIETQANLGLSTILMNKNRTEQNTLLVYIRFWGQVQSRLLQRIFVFPILFSVIKPNTYCWYWVCTELTCSSQININSRRLLFVSVLTVNSRLFLMPFISGSRHHRSTNLSPLLRALLFVPKSGLQSSDDKDFAVKSPRLWNSPPRVIRSAECVISLKHLV